MGKLFTFFELIVWFFKDLFSITAIAPGPPSAPTGLLASKVNSTSVRISWNAASEATSYEAQLYNSATKSWQADYYYTTNTATSYTNKNMRGSGSAQFRVRAVNDYGKSEWVYVTYNY